MPAPAVWSQPGNDEKCGDGVWVEELEKNPDINFLIWKDQVTDLSQITQRMRSVNRTGLGVPYSKGSYTCTIEIFVLQLYRKLVTLNSKIQGLQLAAENGAPL